MARIPLRMPRRLASAPRRAAPPRSTPRCHLATRAQQLLLGLLVARGHWSTDGQGLAVGAVQAIIATLIIQTTLSSIFYWQTFRKAWGRAVYGSDRLPLAPMPPLLASVAVMGALLTGLNLLAIRFGVDTWQEGLQLAAVLWLVDAALNIRWV